MRAIYELSLARVELCSHQDVNIQVNSVYLHLRVPTSNTASISGHFIDQRLVQAYRLISTDHHVVQSLHFVLCFGCHWKREYLTQFFFIHVIGFTDMISMKYILKYNISEDMLLMHLTHAHFFLVISIINTKSAFCNKLAHLAKTISNSPARYRIVTLFK